MPSKQAWPELVGGEKRGGQGRGISHGRRPSSRALGAGGGGAGAAAGWRAACKRDQLAGSTMQPSVPCGASAVDETASVHTFPRLCCLRALHCSLRAPAPPCAHSRSLDVHYAVLTGLCVCCVLQVGKEATEAKAELEAQLPASMRILLVPQVRCCWVLGWVRRGWAGLGWVTTAACMCVSVASACCMLAPAGMWRCWHPCAAPECANRGAPASLTCPCLLPCRRRAPS